MVPFSIDIAVSHGTVWYIMARTKPTERTKLPAKASTKKKYDRFAAQTRRTLTETVDLAIDALIAQTKNNPQTNTGCVTAQ